MALWPALLWAKLFVGLAKQRCQPRSCRGCTPPTMGYQPS